MRRETMREAIAAETYATAVIDILAPEFPDLNDPLTADIVRGHIYAHVKGKAGGLMEVIVDNPVSANWRLTADRANPGRVRLGCWHIPPVPPRALEREARLNEALRAIPMEADR